MSSRLGLPRLATWISMRRAGSALRRAIGSGAYRSGPACSLVDRHPLPPRPEFSSSPFKEERKKRWLQRSNNWRHWCEGVSSETVALAIRSARTVAEAGPGDITFIESERFVKLLEGLAGLGGDRRAALQSRPAGCRHEA